MQQDAEGVWQWDPYFAYLDRVRHRLPPQVAAFATPFTRYSLNSPQSLHDAWLESIQVQEPAEGERHERRSTTITLRLLGAYHDRIHELLYLGVRQYRIDGCGTERGHGELIVHEVRLDDDDSVVHELLFSKGATIEINCADFFHAERPFADHGPAA